MTLNEKAWTNFSIAIKRWLLRAYVLINDKLIWGFFSVNGVWVQDINSWKFSVGNFSNIRYADRISAGTTCKDRKAFKEHGCGI